MDSIDNNQFEIKPNTKSKRKMFTPCPNVYLNPALDLLANEDPMCNTAMEVAPNKKRKRTTSCDIATFENSALDLGISKAAVNEFLMRELENVRKNIRPFESVGKCDVNDAPNVLITDKNISNESSADGSLNDVSMPFGDSTIHSNLTIESTNTNLTDLPTQRAFICNNSPNADSIKQLVPSEKNKFAKIDNCNLLCKMSPLEESNENYLSIVPSDLEISSIGHEIDSGNSVLGQNSIHTIIKPENTDISVTNSTTCIQNNFKNHFSINNINNFSLSFIDKLALNSPNISNQSLYLDDDLNESNIMEIKTITIITNKKKISDNIKNTNPFLEPSLDVNLSSTIKNPFLEINDLNKSDLEYYGKVNTNKLNQSKVESNSLVPRRLFASDTNSTISTVNDSLINMEPHEYENIDDYRSESPVYENVGEVIDKQNYNKQSKILGQDVSRFSALDIMNINKNSSANSSNESNDTKKDLKHQILKASNKLSKKVLKSLKNTFKSDKPEHNVTLNPYEVPRKPPKLKPIPKESGIENPAMNLDNSDEIEIEEINDDEHQYETIKTVRNTRINMNVTPLREKGYDNMDISHNKTNTPSKKVRFDSTLNREKIITGNSFDCGVQSPGFDAKIDKYHDELENCINEKKFLQQNM